MKFENLIVKTPNNGVMEKVRIYNKGTLRIKDNFLYVYWLDTKIDIYSGNFSFEITTKEEK